MSSKMDSLHPRVKELAEKLILEAQKKNLYLVVTQGYRSIQEQNDLYAQGRTKPGKIVTNAKGGQSFHNFGVAFDIAIDKNGTLSGGLTWDAKVDVNANDKPDYEEVGVLGESVGLEWGGRWHFVDLPHFQLTQGLTLQDFKNGKMIS